MNRSQLIGEKRDNVGRFGVHGVFPSRLSRRLNQILFPLKMIIPQPAIKKIPGLLTNEDIRVRQVTLHIKGRLLDIGCGNNRMVKSYRRMGGDGVGVDVHPWDKSVLLVEDASKLPFVPEVFDTITFVACINHIPNRLETLRAARSLLRGHGRVVLTNLHPFISRIWHKWAFWDEDQNTRGMKDGEVWGFTEKNLTKLLDAAGLRVIRRETFSWGLNQMYICEKR